jgi:erythromycin esterase
MTPTKIFGLLFCFFLGACTPKADEVIGPGGPVSTVFQIPQDGLAPLQEERHLDALVNDLGNAGIVLLGGASHGTAGFYSWRAAITRRLVAEKGFKIIAIEGDWPAAYAVNGFVKGGNQYASARQALATFTRWPAWMWANQEMATLADWLRTHNRQQEADRQVGFYGLDVYSLWESVESIRDFPDAAPATLAALDQVLACLGPYNRNTANYAQATKAGGGCGEELKKLLDAVQHQVQAQPAATENGFNAWQNATLAVNAHQYYQASQLSNLRSWNIRVHHQMATLDRLLQQYGPDTKVIIWAHNSLVGDARYSSMAQEGLENLGQLVREKYKDKGVYLVGFGAYQGTMLAASAWGGPFAQVPLPEAQPDSWEAVLHAHEASDKLVLLRQWRKKTELTKPRGHRTFDAVYNAQLEAGSYVPSNLPQRYDALLYLDKTQALQPLSDAAGTLRIQMAGPR